MLLRAMVKLSFLATLVLSAAETPNITLEQYFHLAAVQQDKIVITIANEYAEYYDGKTAQLIRDLFNKKTPGALHTRGVNQIDGLSKEVAKKQDTHSVSLNTLIGKYLVAEYGVPPKLERH